MSCDCTTTTFPDGVIPRVDLTIPLGGDFTKTFVWNVGDPAAPVDLTGYTARMALRSAGQPTIELTTENGRITLGGATGEITLTLAHALTETLAVTTWDYRLDLISGALVYPFMTGFATVPANPAP